MPYAVERRGSQFAVVKEGGGRTFGVHPTRTKAMAQLRALYANTNEESMKDVHHEALKQARDGKKPRKPAEMRRSAAQLPPRKMTAHRKGG